MKMTVLMGRTGAVVKSSVMVAGWSWQRMHLTTDLGERGREVGLV